MLQVGALVDRKYKILSEVGHGGMSVVYLAINERANKTWAIKEVRKDGVCDFEAVRQGLVAETDMLKQLSHPHLPSIVDVIDTEDSFLIVMDYIEGTDLQKILKQEGAQPPELVIEWGKQICDVLGYLHSRPKPIIYRDMKPANIMLKPDGNIALIDFGTAREFKNRAMVEDTTCLGTRGYAAPEQFGGRGQSDARTDIYCTGATLYHLLTGHNPAEPPYEIKPLSYWDPNYAGSGLEKIILKCCQQDPAARYQNCEELMYALEHVQDENDAVLASRRRKWRAFLACLGVFAVGMLGVLAFSLLRTGAIEETYSYYVQQAKEEYYTSPNAATKQFLKAIEIDSASADAYETLVDCIEADADFTPEEQNNAKMCLSVEHDTSLKNGNREAYDRINFKIGKLYFFMAQNSESNMRSASEYFSKITNSEYLSTEELELANAAIAVGKFYNSKGASDKSVFSDTGYSYDALWNDLTKITSGDVKKKLGGNNYCVAMYNRVAFIINGEYSKLLDYGVTTEQLNDELNMIEKGLNELGLTPAENRDLSKYIKSAHESIDEARKALAANESMLSEGEK